MALDDVDGDNLRQFDELSIRDPDKIRAKFGEKNPPEVLYEDGDRKRGKIVGRDEFKQGHVYVWLVNKAAWEEPEILQNALFCSTAVYKENPLAYLKGGTCKNFHTVDHIIAVGDYKSDDKPVQRCMVVLSQNPETKEKMLIVAF